MPQARRLHDAVAVAVATLCGAGRSPVAPGTAGTLAALPLVVIATRVLPVWGYIVATLLLTALGVWSAGAAASHFGLKDPRPVVIDEAAGIFVTLAGLSCNTVHLLVGFLLFRALDVLKPPPARRAEHLPGGWGIMADDLIVGVYANLALRSLDLLVRS
ncbi:MAG TPA: phosphatidylglycerophosphatase A [Candidatus Polarisedimenticolia bacterium]|nr:phosphatidylglycerophosphatase A [Candidatus Polarisedimenticolia bacterium]